MKFYHMRNKSRNHFRYFAATEERAKELALSHRRAKTIDNIEVLEVKAAPDITVERYAYPYEG